jgi:predicted Kef-type K+ transport protein
MAFEMILVAYALGFVAARAGLPPLVGYLGAGFVLHEMGHDTSDGLEAIADLGVFLLLFGIGLKLRAATLAKPVVWASTAAHTVIATLILGGALIAAQLLGLPLAAELDLGQALLLGFALSFSSTVAAVKALEDRSESASLAGQITVGILVIQDIFAVGYLAFTAGKPPSPWAPAVVAGILLLRPVYGWLITHTGHGELFALLGIALAAGVGAAGFDLVGLKPDLGALVVGIAVSGHPRSGELADRILSLKDLLLIGFFLSIGLRGAPPPVVWGLASGLLLLVPVQAVAFLVLITRFRLRSRTALNASLTLATYSEFGLIVALAATAAGDIDERWVSAIAIAVGFSFVAAALLGRWRQGIYRIASPLLRALERHPLAPEDSLIDIADAKVIVFGMGRIGEGAYDEIVRRRGEVAVGVDRKEEVAAAQRNAGRNVVRGDALDSDFWDRIRFHADLELVVVALNSHAANLECVARARANRPAARVAAIAAYPDEVAELRRAGVTVARNLYEEAGQALADDALSILEGQELKTLGGAPTSPGPI